MKKEQASLEIKLQQLEMEAKHLLTRRGAWRRI